MELSDIKIIREWLQSRSLQRAEEDANSFFVTFQSLLRYSKVDPTFQKKEQSSLYPEMVSILQDLLENFEKIDREWNLAFPRLLEEILGEEYSQDISLTP